MTIRRDFDLLEQQGVINRTHGGATLQDPNQNGRYHYIVEEQKTKNIREKNLIGIKAASMVQPHDTIFLDSGTTTPFVAKNLNPDLPITALCYTFTNAMELYPRINTNLILLGGMFHRDSNIFHSVENYDLIRNTRADKAFIATAGLDPRMGLTTIFYYEATVKREMIRAARQIILVSDSTKIGKISVTHFADLNDIHTIITDDGISDEYQRIIQDRGIELIIVNHNKNEKIAKEKYP
jgi:DeoR family deoxyribose operon repressor